MTLSFPSYKDQLQTLVLGFLWRQWTALGVAGQAHPQENRVIDPEALLLVTTTFARNDPRLFDEVLDWLSEEGGTINLQRLKNLRSAYTLGHPGVLAAAAATVGRRPLSLKWRMLAEELTSPQNRHSGRAVSTREKEPAYSIPATPEPLFFDIPVVGKPDELFLRLGWLRDPLQLRGLSTPPDPNRPSNLLLKLRALFGIQARAEIMACLLCTEAAHPAQIAELTGYFPRTVQLALNEMAQSGHILFTREGREKHFQLRKEEWQFLTKRPEGGFPQWVHWAPLFAFLEAVTRKVNALGFESAPAAVQAMELRGAFEAWNSAMIRAGLRPRFQTSGDLAGKEFVVSLMEDIASALG